MIKVVLVDDEVIIREGIKSEINWEALGMEVVGVAEDGEEALELIEKTQPDIIITDVKMPFMDGLQLVEKIKPNYKNTYIVIISGHDEFEYAQKAIKLGAYDYILKPIDLDYLKEILLKIRSDEEIRKKKENEIDLIKQKAAVNLPLLKERFFEDVIYRRIEPESLSSALANLGFDKKCCCVAAIVQIDDYNIITHDMDEERKTTLNIGFYNIIKEIKLDNNVIALSRKYDEYVICIMDKFKEILKTKGSDICNKIHSRANKLALYSVTISVGNYYDSIQFLNKSYNEALHALNFKFVVGKGKVIYFSDNVYVTQNGQVNIEYSILDLISSIKLCDKKLATEKLKKMIETINTKGSNSYLFIQIIVSNIYVELLKLIKESGGTVDEVLKNSIDIYKGIMGRQTLEEIMNDLLHIISKIIDYMDMKRSGNFNLELEKAKEFIRQNYMNDNLTLESVANIINMSPSYFSFVFKQKSGRPFIDFLTNVRIEKAKELLLLSDYKSYEISYMVGYDNPTYFSTIFKKLIKLSPTEYRNKYRYENNLA